MWISMKFLEKFNLKNQRANLIVVVSVIALILVAAIVGIISLVTAKEKEEPPVIANEPAVAPEEKAPESLPKETQSETESEPETERETAEIEDEPTPELVPEEVIIPEPQPEPEPERVYYIVEDDGWNLVLANPWNSLPEDFTVELESIGGGHRVDRRIVYALDTMMADLCQDGRSAFVCSSYRTNTKQTTLYNNKINSYLSQGYAEEDAAVEAGKWVAVPGTSEHQLGLAVDIMASSYLSLDEGQENTKEQQWLMENSYKYGFILRYPNNKTEITGIYYEPWHYRYVGVVAATEMYERGICFEEYLAG